MLVFLALANAKVLSFALGDAKVPNASSFAFWWNIGFSQFLHLFSFLANIFVIISSKLGYLAVKGLIKQENCRKLEAFSCGFNFFIKSINVPIFSHNGGQVLQFYR